MVPLTVVMTHGALSRRPAGCIYSAPRQASRFLTRAEPLGSMFKMPIQALVPLTEDRTGCWGPAGLRGSMFIVPIQALAQITEANPPFFYVVWSTGSEYLTSSSRAARFTKLHLDSVIYIGSGGALVSRVASAGALTVAPAPGGAKQQAPRRRR